MSAERHHSAQTRTCRDAILTVLQRALFAHRPADRVLISFFRRHRHLGARDRRLVRETVFATLRWWGWLKALFPEPLPETPATNAGAPDASFSAAAWASFLLASHVLEGRLPRIATHWMACAAVSPEAIQQALAEPDALTRWHAYRARLGGDATLKPARLDLIPAWAQREICVPRPLDELVRWLQQRPPLWLRLQGDDQASTLAALAAERLSPTPHPLITAAVQIRQPAVDLQTLRAYRDGRCEVQDLASQVVGLVCAPRPEQRWWDACAGAGGKTLQLADLMRHTGNILATDIRQSSLGALQQRARRAHAPSIQTRSWNGALPLPAPVASFDGVLLDAPCSGSGRWRRNPDARWSARAESLTGLVTRQRQLLESAAQGVRPGGTLVYATCSLFARENEAVVAAFLRDTPHFVLEPFLNPLDHTLNPGTLQIWPWPADCDALFVARLRRCA